MVVKTLMRKDRNIRGVEDEMEHIELGKARLCLYEQEFKVAEVFPNTTRFVEELFCVSLRDITLRFLCAKEGDIGFSLGGEIWVPEWEEEFGQNVLHELGHEADRKIWDYVSRDRYFSEEIAIFTQFAGINMREYVEGHNCLGREVIEYAKVNGWRKTKLLLVDAVLRGKWFNKLSGTTIMGV